MRETSQSFSFGLLIVMTFFSLIASFFSIVMTFIIPMAFAMIENANNLTDWIVFISFITIPPVCLLSLVSAWICYTTKRYEVACYFSLIPWINIFLLASVGMSF